MVSGLLGVNGGLARPPAPGTLRLAGEAVALQILSMEGMFVWEILERSGIVLPSLVQVCEPVFHIFLLIWQF